MWGQGGASDFVLCLGVWYCVGRYFGFGLYLGFRCGNWEVLCVLDCIWGFAVGIGRCFVFWIVFAVSLWELGGALCIGVVGG